MTTSVNGTRQVGMDFAIQPSLDEQKAVNGFADAVLAGRWRTVSGS